MNKKMLLLAMMFGSSVAAGAVDVQDAIKQVKKNNFEKAIAIQEKVKSGELTSDIKLLCDISECMLYNSPKYSDYNPMRAYSIYNTIQYSDHLTDAKVLNAMREEQITLDGLRQNIEDNLMKNARQQNTVAAYDEIINACQGCSYLDQAKSERDNIVFDNTLSGATLSEVNKFISDYPNSPKRKQAIRLRDSLAYDMLPKTSDAYQQYIENYPESPWTPGLKKNLEKMAYTEAKQEGSINAYAKYIANYPDNTRQVKEFEDKIKEDQSTLSWKVAPTYDYAHFVKDTIDGNEYIIVKQGAFYGILTNQGLQLIEPKFEAIDEICGCLMKVKVGGKWGIVNPQTGDVVYSCILASKSDIRFLNKSFTAVKNGGFWGIMYHDGKEIVSPFIPGSFSARNYKILVKGGLAVTDGQTLKVIEPNGTISVDQKYDEVSWRTSEDVDSRFIKIRNAQKYGVVSPVGKVMFEPQFDMMPFFDADGICSVKNLFKEGWIDTTGKFLYYDRLTLFKDCGSSDKMIAYVANGKLGFIDKKQVYNIPLKYTALGECFNNGLARVKDNEQWVYINRKGETVYTVPSGAKSQMVDGIVRVQNGNKLTLVNNRGDQFDASGYDDVDDEIASNYMIVTKGGLKGAIDKAGQLVVPVKYSEMNRYCKDYSIVKENGKYGMYYKNKLVVETIYDRLQDPGSLFNSNCNEFADGKVSNVVFISAFQGTDNKKIILKDGKILFSTPDEVRLVKPVPDYTIVQTAAYGVFSDAHCALVGPKGEVLVKPSYAAIEYLPTEKGTYFAYKNSNGKWGILNSRGAIEVSEFADKIVSYNGSEIVAVVKGDTQYFDKFGISALPKGYDVDGLILKNKQTGKYGVVDAKGYIRVYPEYDSIDKVTNTFAIVSKDGKFGLLQYR